MDPNMMNQNYQMGGVEPQMMSYQEQTQAQVLNYNDVEMTAEKENKAKSTKKIALFFAALGIILVAGGVFYTLNPTDEQTTVPTTETKNIEDQTPAEDPGTETPADPAQPQTASTTSTCTLSDESGTDGTTRETMYTLVYDANTTLMSYSKKYTVTSLQGAQKAAGVAKVKDENTTLTNLMTILNTTPVTGYTLAITPTQEGDDIIALTATVNVDFSTLDISKIPAEISKIAVTKVDLSKGQSQEDVKALLTSYGCVCQ